MTPKSRKGGWCLQMLRLIANTFLMTTAIIAVWPKRGSEHSVGVGQLKVLRVEESVEREEHFTLETRIKNRHLLNS